MLNLRPSLSLPLPLPLSLLRSFLVLLFLFSSLLSVSLFSANLGLRPVFQTSRILHSLERKKKKKEKKKKRLHLHLL